MNDATIRKWANRVWRWVDDTTNIARVKTHDDVYDAPIFYRTIIETDVYGPQLQSSYRKMPAKEARFQPYRFMPLDAPAIVLRLAFAREINTVFVKENAET